jgi:hypothetical protein
MRVLSALCILEEKKLIILIGVKLKTVLMQKIVEFLGIPLNKISFPF